ncbi:MAG TPA: dicarboxylate/amino acid:cation symporter, partial [Pirellulales bacterium]|nr:dicarboxylate/amino acid:cation symporter [Pirellulales bacterium]
LVIGFAVGQYFFSFADEATRLKAVDIFDFLGTTFFMNLLKMMLVPLVASSVIVGVASIGDPSSLGRIGSITILYYFATMVIAVVLGLALVTSIRPGKGIDPATREKGEEAYSEVDDKKRGAIEERGAGGLFGAFKNIASQMIPSNPIGAAAEGKILPVITASMLLGIVLTVIGPAGRPLLQVCEAIFAAVMKLVDWVILLAPFGVACLVAYTVAKMGGGGLLKPLFLYMVTVILGLAIHALVVLPLVLWIFGRTNPYRFMHQMREALMTAFGTDSSSATLPVTMDIAQELGGVSKRSAGFVLPLGATINMDGTALYEAVAVVFLFQCYGVELGVTELGIIAVTATLAAVGAAGIPSAGLVTMVIVVQAVNGALGPGVEKLPMAAVGILLGVDRILDMCRTTVNVWGDAVGAKLITRIAPD